MFKYYGFQTISYLWKEREIQSEWNKLMHAP